VGRGSGGGGRTRLRFLGVDLAWKRDNSSGVVALDGGRFPLRLVEAPRTLPTHDAVLEWIEDRWDALLCALAVALAELRPGSVRAYAGGRGPRAWRRGYILAPGLAPGRDVRVSANMAR